MKHDQWRKLRQSLHLSTILTYQQAQAQLYEVVMAEQSGYDVESTYQEFFKALDVYTELAEEYQTLHADLKAMLDNE